MLKAKTVTHQPGLKCHLSSRLYTPQPSPAKQEREDEKMRWFGALAIFEREVRFRNIKV